MQPIERPTTALSTPSPLRNAALQPVPRHPLDDLIAVRGRVRRDRGKRLRAGAEASAFAGDSGVAVIQARPSGARAVANTSISPGIKAKRFHRVSDPTDISYNCNPLARRNILDPDAEIVPRGARKSRIELVVEPNVVVSFK